MQRDHGGHVRRLGLAGGGCGLQTLGAVEDIPDQATLAFRRLSRPRAEAPRPAETQFLALQDDLGLLDEPEDE